MKNASTKIGLLLLFFSASFGLIHGQNDVKKLGLNGEVKRITSKEWNVVTQFNKYGYITDISHYPHGLLQKETFLYDEKNLLIGKELIKDGELFSKSKLIYNRRGLLIKEIEIAEKDVFFFPLKAHKNIKIEKGSVLNIVKYKYNWKGHLKKRIDPSDSVSKYYYNKKGMLEKEVLTYYDIRQFHRFDSIGNIIEMIVNYSDGKQNVYTYQYTTWDSFGNWTKCISNLNHGGITTETREIEY